jgi:putative FmdB family regulatory protein
VPEAQEDDVPTYQYACTVCGHQIEAVQSFTDAPLTECPQCAGRLRKLFSSVGIVFKGSGFYRNDSRSDKSGNGASPAKETVSSGAGSGSDSSPATSSSSSSPSSSSSSSDGGGSGAAKPAESSKSGSKTSTPAAA